MQKEHIKVEETRNFSPMLFLAVLFACFGNSLSELLWVFLFFFFCTHLADPG